VMLVASAITGGALSEGDRFRKAVQKCSGDQERLKLSQEFLARCRAAGVDRDYAKSIWVQMAKFNAYSFCRAHAASYAQLACAAAYLKTHYPLEFWTAALNNNQSMYHPRVYVEHAKRDGVRFRLPDVSRSGEEFSIDGDAVRVGMNLIDGLGPVHIARILAERKRRPFEHLTDFLRRTRLGEAEARAMILCGAFDAFGRTRPTLMVELNLLGKKRPERPATRTALLPTAPRIPQAPGDYSPRRKYMDERRILGISVREHIMALLWPVVAGRFDTDSRQLPRRVGRRVRIAGVIEAQRTVRTENGRTMMFLTMEDQYGLFEVTLFPDVYQEVRAALAGYGPYLVSAKVEDQYGAVTLTAETLELIEESTEELCREKNGHDDTALVES